MLYTWLLLRQSIARTIGVRDIANWVFGLAQAVCFWCVAIHLSAAIENGNRHPTIADTDCVVKPTVAHHRANVDQGFVGKACPKGLVFGSYHDCEIHVLGIDGNIIFVGKVACTIVEFYPTYSIYTIYRCSV